MKHSRAVSLTLLLIGVASRTLSAQATAQTATAPSDEVVVLSPFTVSESATGRYQATEATSGTRVRVSLFESPQSVSVITRDLMDDISPGRIVDAARYAAGVTESTIPNAQDRTTIRGFQNDGATIDGFSYFSFANVDPVLIDRIEIVKGPNAIIAPQGVPGGTINMVSKKPFFQDRGWVSAQVGRYSANRGEVDVNRVAMGGKLAVRVVGAVQQADDYGQNNFHHSVVAMPMFTYRFGPATDLTVQLEVYNWRALNYGGVPISLYATSSGNWHILEGLPRDFNAQDDDITRHQSAQHYRAFFTSKLSDALSLRIAGNLINSYATSGQLNIGNAANQVTTTDPATGLRVWNGATRNDSPAFPLGGSINNQSRRYVNFQADLAYEVKGQNWRSTTVAGYAYTFSATYNEKNRNFTVTSPQNLSNYVHTAYVLTNVTGINTRHPNDDHQVYVNEVLGLMDERLILNGGLSAAWYYSQNWDQFNNVAVNRVTHTPHAILPAFGVVYKLTDQLAAYYGFTKQATAINPNVTSANFFDTQTSRQHEAGLRAQMLDRRLYVTLAYFDIKQNNFSIPNPANSAVPVPSPLLPPLFSDRIAHGVELELNFAINRNLSLVANGTVMKNRDADNVPFRGTAEKTGAFWLNYHGTKGEALDGFSFGLGVDYLAKRAGDTASGATSASTPTKVIRVQPSFWLPARTLVNASIGYRFNEHWRTQLNIDNLLNTEYLQSSTGRSAVWVGAPLNARLTATYSF